MKLKGVLPSVTRPLGLEVRKCRSAPANYLPQYVALVEFVRLYTMTSSERTYALAEATGYIVKCGVERAFVECGVWRGGSTMTAARALIALGEANRVLCLYDIVEGVPKPTEADVYLFGSGASSRLWRSRTGVDASTWDKAMLDEVTANIAKTGYDLGLVHYVDGKVEETLPAQAPETIDLLRLDSDGYESTRHELITLWPRLAPGGVLIVNDYGH